MFAKIKSYLLILGGLVAALFAVYMQGKSSGRGESLSDKLKEEAARRKMATEGGRIQSEVSLTPEDELRKELKKWEN